MRKVRLPRKVRMVLWVVSLVALIVSSLFFSQTPSKQSVESADKDTTLGESTATNSAYVEKVVDGDTIHVIINGQKAKVRLIGINTPETVDPRRPVECFGKEASLRLKELIENKEVILEGDSTQADRDRYDRYLRYVYLEEVIINELLISEGYAYEYTYDLPYLYQDRFIGAQKIAQEKQLGLWNPQTCRQ